MRKNSELLACIYPFAAQVVCGSMLHTEVKSKLVLLELSLVIFVGLISLPEDVGFLTALESLVYHGVDRAI